MSFGGNPNILDYIIAAVPTAILSVPYVVWFKLQQCKRALKLDAVLPLAMLAWFLLILEALVWQINAGARVSLDEAGLDTYVRLFFLGSACVLILYIGALTKLRWLAAFSYQPVVWFGLMVLLFAISLIWSKYPALTGFKTVEYAANLAVITLLAYFASRSQRPWEITKLVFDLQWVFLAIQLALVYLGVVIWPNMGLQQGVGLLGVQIQGVFPDIPANTVGELSAILALVALVRLWTGWANPRWFYGLVSLVCLGTMILAQSRSPILGFVLGVVLVLIAQRRWGLLFLGAGLSLVLVSTYYDLFFQFMARGQETSGNLQSLSGRTVWWSTALAALQDHFFTGFGAYAGSRFIFREYLGSEEVASLHNSYMEVLAGVGIIGALLLLVGVVVSWGQLASPPKSYRVNSLTKLLWLEGLAIMSVQTIRSIFSATFVYVDLLTFGLVLMFLVVKQHERTST